MGRLEGKAVLITGAASGIGAACAQRCAREGAQVAGMDVAPPSGECWSEVEKSAPGAMFVTADVRDEAAVEATVEQVRERFGAIDG
ncbi:MAG: SDR family NAD(P)-dependent oxidoreductase, partial [Deltaproteobacteria bacterium]|nr:SDR family NAD(P)-dependent oxidoreductase [Deltaproteobacteria bacterium]